MDNFNALSKSAILTKLGLDGYFIDLATLNTFISSWKIEAIYENELGIEFFDEEAYKTILNKLKEKYVLKRKDEDEKTPVSSGESANNTKIDENNCPVCECPAEAPYKMENIENTLDSHLNNEINTGNIVALDALETENEIAENTEEYNTESQNILDDIQIEDEDPELQETACIMPRGMSSLLPGPVSPHSSYETIRYKNKISQEKVQGSITVIKESLKKDKEKITQIPPLDTETPKPEKEEVKQLEVQNKLEDNDDDLLNLAKSLSAENKTEQINPQSLDEIFEQPYVEPFSDLEAFADKKNDDVDLKELSHYFEGELKEKYPQTPTVNTYKDKKDVSGIDTVQSDSLSADVNKTVIQNANTEDIKEIIRQEVSKQTQNVAAEKKEENIQELVKNEVSKQTQNMALQTNTGKNTFNLDISQGTLDMIAKTIAKKIAIKLNNYYKLNSTKQNAKIQLYRERTIELKEKVQNLEDENKKLKMLLLETNKNLNSYKPAFLGLFNLYKFQKSTRKKRK